MRFLLALALLAFAGSAAAAPVVGTCSPVRTGAGIYASADATDIHPDWADGSEVGLGWTFEQRGDEAGADGSYYLFGDLLDSRGNVVNQGVYVSDMQWECDAAE